MVTIHWWLYRVVSQNDKLVEYGERGIGGASSRGSGPIARLSLSCS